MENIFSRDLLDLGQEADRIRQEKWGKKTFFVRNLHLNYTNICVSKCRFCAFEKDEGEDPSVLADALAFYVDRLPAPDCLGCRARPR